MASTSSDNPLLAFLQQNTTLRALLADGEVQANLAALLTAEQQFQARQQHYQSRPRYHSKAGASGFPNPNTVPLSPIEKKLLEGGESKEQQALRLLVKDILEA